MFSLTVLDHIRLESEQAARNYTAHAGSAERLAKAALAARVGVMALLAGAAVAAVVNVLVPRPAYAIIALASAATAMIGFAFYAVIGFEPRVSGHRAMAHRLWLVCADYRALIAEAEEGLVETPLLIQRRDRLTNELNGIYEREFGADQRGFEPLRLPPAAAKRAA